MKTKFLILIIILQLKAFGQTDNFKIQLKNSGIEDSIFTLDSLTSNKYIHLIAPNKLKHKVGAITFNDQKITINKYLQISCGFEKDQFLSDLKKGEEPFIAIVDTLSKTEYFPKEFCPKEITLASSIYRIDSTFDADDPNIIILIDTALIKTLTVNSFLSIKGKKEWEEFKTKAIFYQPIYKNYNIVLVPLLGPNKSRPVWLLEKMHSKENQKLQDYFERKTNYVEEEWFYIIFHSWHPNSYYGHTTSILIQYKP